MIHRPVLWHSDELVCSSRTSVFWHEDAQEQGINAHDSTRDNVERPRAKSCLLESFLVAFKCLFKEIHWHNSFYIIFF